MTSTPQNRVSAGIPTGGQFTHSTHSEPGVSLSPARQDALEGWPIGVPEPEVDFTLGDDGSITTSVKIKGEPVFEVWNPGEDIHSIESSDFECAELADEGAYELAQAWAFAKHEEIATELRAEIDAAVGRARHSVLAKATGQTKQLTDDELELLTRHNIQAVQTAVPDAERGAAALVSRRALKDFPDADTIDLRVDWGGEIDYVSGAVVYDASGNKLGEYSSADRYLESDEISVEDEQFYEHLNGLSANPDTAWWSDFNPFIYENDDKFKIDLKKASAWNPGAEV